MTVPTGTVEVKSNVSPWTSIVIGPWVLSTTGSNLEPSVTRPRSAQLGLSSTSTGATEAAGAAATTENRASTANSDAFSRCFLTMELLPGSRNEAILGSQADATRQPRQVP